MRSRGIDWDAQPLGQIPDREIAARLGCSETAVGYARKRRRIPSPIPPTRRTTTRHLRPPEVLVTVMSTLALRVIAGWTHDGCHCPVQFIEAELKRRNSKGVAL